MCQSQCIEPEALFEQSGSRSRGERKTKQKKTQFNCVLMFDHIGGFNSQPTLFDSQARNWCCRLIDPSFVGAG